MGNSTETGYTTFAQFKLLNARKPWSKVWQKHLAIFEIYMYKAGVGDIEFYSHDILLCIISRHGFYFR